MKPTNKQLVDAYKEMGFDREAEGWEAYLITFMFDDIPGSQAHVKNVMRNEVERVYSTMATRIVRTPSSPSHNKKLPLLIAAPDWPVAKHVRSPKRLIIPNDGVHVQGVIMLAPVSRLRGSFEAHIVTKQSLYLRPPLSVLHVEPVTENLGRVMDYILKSLTSHRIDSEDLIILPRSLSELSRR